MAGYNSEIGQLGSEATRWLISKMHDGGIKSSKQLKSKEAEFQFSRFIQSSSTEQFQIDKRNVEKFLKEFFGHKNFADGDINQLITAVKYADQGSKGAKCFKFRVGTEGNFDTYYVALKGAGDKFYILSTQTTVTYELSPEKVSWFWFWTTTEAKKLTTQQQNDLDNFLVFQAVKCLMGSVMGVRDNLSKEDQKFLEC